MAAQRTLHYFAYGSNLDPGTFLGRRRMQPLSSAVARLDGYSLVFDLAVGRGERGVANVRRAPGDHVWGVSYEITLRDAQYLDRSEGVHRGGYRRLGVRLVLADGSEQEAYTFESGRGRPGRKPSRRYMGLLLSGSRQHGLPAQWLERLRAQELAVDERSRQGELFGHPRTSQPGDGVVRAPGPARSSRIPD